MMERIANQIAEAAWRVFAALFANYFTKIESHELHQPEAPVAA